ncbi:TetR/AcrR family transcriptional regulator [Pseudonocardia acaciae]|uniref:TetR/AcrR family transcriptional regulator n=1 Tax=Pseudonocardia acaciae TaxID=551276 RepID=UPI0007E8B8C8|nr:TetR/AcrR family transcriptional regulator [Pseudonocardia acaciae]
MIGVQAARSRSTLVRRLGGSRRALEEAVRAAGVDPGGRVPVRRRAVDAAARLISEQGVAAMTLEAAASAAGCSVHGLYATFAGRDGLLSAVYESYTPLFDIEALLEQPGHGLEQTVYGIYRAFATGLSREPRVAPMMLADAFARPDGAAGQLVQRFFPRALGSIGGWLSAEIAAGRIRRLPIALLLHQLLGPLLLHLLSGPLITRHVGPEKPSLDEACATFAAAFVQAVGTSEPPTSASKARSPTVTEGDRT